MLHTDSATNDDLPALIAAVEDLWGAAHLDELPKALADKDLVSAAVTAGALSLVSKTLLVAPGADPRVVRARRFRGRLTCASAAQILGYPLDHPPSRTHIAIPANHGFRPSRSRTLDDVVLHRKSTITPITVEGAPLVIPSEVVACALRCLDELEAITVADAALGRGDTTVEELQDLLTSRYDATARRRLEEVEPRTRSPLETPVRIWLRRAGFEVECCVPIEGVGEVDHLIDGWLILEEDGFEFHRSQEQFLADRRRVSAAGALGYPTLRLTYEDVRAGEEHVVRIVSGFMIGLARSPRISLPKNVEILRKRGIQI
ncbi:hypothetical protein [Actinomyces marmotae]|uniref:hypothetical protein n=1 Tax=Actinomyces marmotae TaxID=2737173 RepID=UPI001F3C690E|nr:hypothetical protein [Actinomyces marmotae]